MRLVIVSHKPCWFTHSSPSGYVTDGGFPFQIQAISELFDQTILVVPLRMTPLPAGSRPLIGHNLEICPLEDSLEYGLRRKLAMLFWLPRNLPHIWRETQRADAVHTPVPGDIGTIGVLVALAQRKPLFVRHCGTWGEPVTLADRFLLWLLKHIAGSRNVVMATGGADSPPCRRNRTINWIFSTTLSKQEMSTIPTHHPWRFGQALRLVTVGRLSPGKNTAAIIRALALVRKEYPLVSLDVVGDGISLRELKRLAICLSLDDAVTFHGSLPHEEVMKTLAKSHLFVFPTRVKEGFPKAVLEALACGLPVIATALSVIPRLIGNGNGILLKGTEPGDVAKSILQLVADERRFAKMSASARKTSLGYTLEGWRDLIGDRLRAVWGPLRPDEPQVSPS